MDTVTLDRAEVIARAINEYGEKHDTIDFDHMVQSVEKAIKGVTRHEVSAVIEFLQKIQTTVETMAIAPGEQALTVAEQVAAYTSKPLDLATEIQYNYGVARTLLNNILQRNSTIADSEEIRKTLREISRFSDAMLKMQERVHNVQQVQRFQETVLEVLEDLEPDVRDKIVEALLEASI